MDDPLLQRARCLRELTILLDLIISEVIVGIISLLMCYSVIRLCGNMTILSNRR